ncbi:LacI family DNA-binding transcriptional regulator [Paenibacillus sp. R14(2021)]|uniref:LacI family DNA-binding transcriptional regulator n=1 Tax=Paenibacillus sp. R14(2021) TaxID=2859228 RepID=UPI001C6121D7|nr:LacI family DNA-binding transcriptional regulator [Paenibacillus sp. R14(2021)]
MKISIFDVAKKSGLSVVTVSRVLNGAESVRESNRQKVLAAMKELDYRPSAAARSLAKGKTGIIGLILTTLQDSFFDAIINELNRILSSHGYFLALSVSTETEQGEEHYLIQEDRVDGIILLSPLAEDRFVMEIKRRNIPYVLIDNQQPEHDANAVNVDNSKGGYMASKHLIELGHTSIAHLSGSECFRSTRERRDGFLLALREAGLEPFELAPGDYDTEFGYQTAKRWAEANQLPTAVFAGDDYIAAGVINALTEAGAAVPGDVAVIGYDDQRIASQLRPFLTTIRQPADTIAAAAADMLLKRLDGTLKRASGVRVEPSLIERQTTAGPRSSSRPHTHRN